MSKYIMIFFIASCALQASGTVPYALKGIVEIHGEARFSVMNLANNQSVWLRLKQSYGYLKIDSYDRQKNCVVIDLMGESHLLELKMADPTPLQVGVNNLKNNPDYTRFTEAQIEAKIEQYKKTELAKIPDLDNPQLKAAMDRSVLNRVNTYATDLREQANTPSQDSTSKITSNDSTPPASNVKPRIGSLRIENKVNSRVWASDHIEKFGMPEEVN